MFDVKKWEKENNIVAYKWDYSGVKGKRTHGIAENGKLVKLFNANDKIEVAEIVKPLKKAKKK